MAILLATLGGALFGWLGVVHLVLTLTTRPDRGGFAPTDPEVQAALARPSGLGLAPTLQIPIWKPWIGFNLSHSIGAVLTGLVIAVPPAWWGGLVLQHPLWLLPSLVLPPAFLAISVRYWFAAPTRGIAIGTALVWGGVAWGWLL